MTNIKKESKVKAIRVKAGSVDEFFSIVGSVMQTADAGHPIKPRVKTLYFEDPTEMIHFLSTAKLMLIKKIKEHPDSITNLAKITHRKISAVTRDINELEKVGIVRTHSVVNPGHGRKKIIELSAKNLRLEACI